jgi:N-glycosylase/DNA lyase
MSKTCAGCDVEKIISEFYEKYLHYSRFCKECISVANRRIKKPTGFTALPSEVQDLIKQDLQNRRLKVKDIAAKHGVAYANLGGWIRKGQIV